METAELELEAEPPLFTRLQLFLQPKRWLQLQLHHIGHGNVPGSNMTYSLLIIEHLLTVVLRIEERIVPGSLKAIVTGWHFYGFLLTSSYSAVL